MLRHKGSLLLCNSAFVLILKVTLLSLAYFFLTPNKDSFAGLTAGIITLRYFWLVRSRVLCLELSPC